MNQDLDSNRLSDNVDREPCVNHRVSEEDVVVSGTSDGGAKVNGCARRECVNLTASVDFRVSNGDFLGACNRASLEVGNRDASREKIGVTEGDVGEVDFGRTAEPRNSDLNGLGPAENMDIKCNDTDDEAITPNVGGHESHGQETNALESQLRQTSDGSAVRSVKVDPSGSSQIYYVSEYNTMLSMFDEFASSGSISSGKEWISKPPAYVYEVGDMVWGKVKSHPWWPGHIFSEEFASPSVRRSKREGHLLVAFFGDSSYGWFDLAELIPFDSNYAEKSRQTNSRTFLNAVEEAVDEACRRRALGLACRCRNAYNFRLTNVNGFFVVDVGDHESGAVYSITQIRNARDSFQPREALSFAKQLALAPLGSEHSDIHFIKNKAAAFAYRKAVFEEFDETYAQAFGYQADRPPAGPVHEQATGRIPSKAPLSGRLVVAETLGKEKSSTKPNRVKDQSKDKYLFKRRDEPTPSKPIELQFTPSPHHPPIFVDSTSLQAGSYVLQKKPPPVSGKPQVAAKPGPASSTFPPAAFDGVTRAEPFAEDKGNSFVAQLSPWSSVAVSNSKYELPPIQPVKIHKQPLGEIGTEKSDLAAERKQKNKRKKELMISSNSQPMPQKVIKVTAEPTQTSLTPKGEPPVVEHRKNDLLVSSFIPSDATVDLELPQLLGDLQGLALDNFHGLDKRKPAIARQVFLKFRSLVYQKSLALSPTPEDELNDTRWNKSPAVVMATESSGILPPKPKLRQNEVTKLKRQRVPSDRQEEMAAKKKKKVNDIKALTAEKRSLQKSPEASKILQKLPEASKHPVGVPLALPKKVDQSPVRASVPTMLVMKFPVGGSLPSVPELKARFARFGPMDHSGTRVFWKSLTCRLVYRSKPNAESAYKFVMNSSTLFGNAGVKCHLREVEPLLDSEQPLKVPEQKPPVPGALSAAPGGVQLKSILKKSAGEEASGVGNGNGRGPARVKFVLGEEESGSGGEQIPAIGNTNNSTSFSLGGSSNASSASSLTAAAASHATMDYHSKSLPKVNLLLPSPLPPLLPPPTAPPAAQFIRLPLPPPPLAIATAAVPQRFAPQNVNKPVAPPLPVDIAPQMLNLLVKCNDVVTNVTGSLGYVPYHPL